jgi:hypothetical protein
MYLLILEGLGVLLGYLIGFYGRGMDIRANTQKRKVFSLATASILIIALSTGIISYAHVMELDSQITLKDYILGFVLLSLPGVAVGMFVNWLTEKISGAK